MGRVHLSLLAVVVGLGAMACDNDVTDPSPSSATFRVEACGSQQFAIRLTDPDLVRGANDLIGRDDQPIVNGLLVRGDGGFNAPWSWHLEPGSIQFADFTTEVCDGCPQMVEDDLDYWAGTVGRFCPWTSRVVARID